MKHRMMLLWIGLSFFCNRALAVRVDTSYVYSVPYNVDSSKIFLVAYTQVGSTSCHLQWIDVMDTLDFIEVNLCYVGGPALTPCMTLDSIDLGVRKNGTVNVMAIFKEYFQGQCKGSFVYKDTFEFTINNQYNNITPAQNLFTGIKLTPNPATSQLTCALTNTIPKTTLQIFSIEGRAITQQIPATQSNTEIDVSHLPAGLYFLVVQDEKQRAVRRFVKE